MADDESLIASLGLTGALPPLPDDVWNHMLEVALDPTTEVVDAGLVPEQDDLPPLLEEDDLALIDDDGSDPDEDPDGAILLDGADEIPQPHVETSNADQHDQSAEHVEVVDDFPALASHELDIDPVFDDHGSEIHHDPTELDSETYL